MKTARNIFWMVLVLSLAATVILVLRERGFTSGVNAPTQPDLAPWVTMITAVGSLIGVAITSILSLRRDRLESRKIELEMKKIELEIDNLKKKPEKIDPA